MSKETSSRSADSDVAHFHLQSGGVSPKKHMGTMLSVKCNVVTLLSHSSIHIKRVTRQMQSRSPENEQFRTSRGRPTFRVAPLRYRAPAPSTVLCVHPMFHPNHPHQRRPQLSDSKRGKISRRAEVEHDLTATASHRAHQPTLQVVLPAFLGLVSRQRASEKPTRALSMMDRILRVKDSFACKRQVQINSERKATTC